MTILQAPRKTWTAEDLARLPAEEHCELIEGALVPMSPPGAEHGNTTQRLSGRVSVYAEDHDLGETFTSETGFLIARNPDTVLAPDFAFVVKERLPEQLPKTYLTIVPDLVVETRSPNDTKREVETKVARWLAIGVRVVWEVDPARQTLTVHEDGKDLVVLRPGDTLTGGDLLPGFSYPVRRLFRAAPAG